MTPPHGGAAGPSGPGGPTAAGAGPSGPPAADESLPAAPGTVHDLEEAVHHLADEDRPPPAGSLANVVVAAAVVALGAAVLVGSASFGLGSASAPAAGTWPFLVGLVIVVLGLALVPLARRTADAERFTRSAWLVLVGLATMVAFVGVIGVIGFEIPAGLLLFVWLKLLGREGWRLSLLTSVGAVVAFYLIFVVALSVPIPHLF